MPKGGSESMVAGARDKGESGEETSGGCRGSLGSILELNWVDVSLTMFVKSYWIEDIQQITQHGEPTSSQ